jgi:predicted dehydrogenase
MPTMTQSQHSRRDFLKKSLVAAAAGSTIPYVGWSQKAFANSSANDRPKMGCVGVGGQGCWDAHQHVDFADIVAVCDVDSNHAEAAKHDPNLGKGKADIYHDYRKLLDRHDIDVVSIATHDVWHVKIAIEALQAGKHVFCEKPLTLTLEENQLIRNACKKYNSRVFMVGTQQRSTQELFLRAINMVQKRLLGDIRKMTAGINTCPTGGPFPKVAPPKELDWDFWLGQAPKVEYIKERCHSNFRWWYEYSGGKFTDWGAHHVDVAIWALQRDRQGTGPVEIDGTDAKHPIPLKDGYPTRDDCYYTSHDFAIKCKFADGVELVVDSRSPNGILFEGTKGRLFVDRGKITGKPIEEQWDKGQFGPDDLTRLYKGKPFESHKQNFYRCIREGGLTVSDVFSHVQTMNICHLCTIAARLGRTIHWDPQAEKITGDDQAAAFFARQQRPGFEIPKV